MPKIEIITDDFRLDVASGYSLFRLADEQNTSIIFGCSDGVCGTCLINFLEGLENVDPPDQDEKDFLEDMGAKPTERLACRCIVRGDIKIEVSD